LGRDKDPFLGRAEYVKWSKETNEREDIADRLRNSFPGLSVALGGQTGLDIGPWGSDKSQILRDFSEDDEIYFFGDRMEKGGNDYSLGEAVKEMGGYPYTVNGWKETRTILEGILH
jgi:phosphomannomutase